MIQTFQHRNLHQSYDWKLLFLYLALVLIGWINIYASVHSAEGTGILDWELRSGKQLIWIITAFGLGGLILFLLPTQLWEGGSTLLYVMVLGLLVAVIFLGVEVKGSKSWFEFGPVRFQPAEVSKITTSLLLAYIMSRPGYKISKFKDFLSTALVIGVPMLVILAESETGSALVYVGLIFVLYREGFSGWFLTFVGLAILLFILTLTVSPYASILTAIALISIFEFANSGRLWKWILILCPLIILFALFPWAHRQLCEYLIPGSSLLADESLDPFIADTIMRAGHWTWLLKIKPLYILLGGAAAAFPFFIYSGYKDRSGFRLLSSAAFLISVALVFSTSFIFNDVLQDHQRKRIEVLLGMKEDPSGVGYNVNQSMIAIGSGGVFGKGYLNGTQTTYGFVPEQSTDFIFCTVGEEWGFAGSVFVIMLYVLMIWRLVADAEHSRESFTRIYGYCVASCLFMHLFINIGMTIGIMPVIGIPLPLLSYGGSSLWAFTIMIFIFLALDHEEKKYF